jgi:hypothetical protein
MATDDDLDDLGIGKPEPPIPIRRGRSGGWPKLPDLDATLVVIRDYLTTCAALRPGWVVESARRFGQYGNDPLTITVRTPGTDANIEIRFESQRDCAKPAALRGAFAEATKGASRMKYPKPAEASDFYLMVCALAESASTATIADETEAWLHEYLGLAWVLEDLTFEPPHRYDTLNALRKRREFDRRQAGRYLRGDLDEKEHWTVVVDSESDKLWIRVGELATYMRHVYGIGTLPMHTLDARIRETGGERDHVDEDLRTQGGRHLSLVFYRFPTAQAFPTVSRMRDSDD